MALKTNAEKIAEATGNLTNLTDGKLKSYNVYLSIKHMEILDIKAKEEGLKRADLIRRAIREYINNN